MQDKNLFQSIPKIDTLLNHKELQSFPKSILLPIIQSHINTLRESIRANTHNPPAQNIFNLQNLILEIKAQVLKATTPTLECVINATGVVIQTNLGRSIFSQELIEEITPFLCHYHTLEYDLHEGQRTERYIHSIQILCELFGCEDALLVNNNAASVLLILNTFAQNKEVIISRGELVEIGGSFRIPEVMKSASSILREVGTTNKTHLKDYQEAINPQSAMIMKAHQSNFKQIGFVSSCSIKELTKLAQANELIDYIDLGSGHSGVLKLKDEPSVQEVLKAKPSLISFSGDKLLGGPQVGIILGKSHLIKALKANQLLRALRVDKFSILTLQATLQAYKDKAYHKIPTLSMLLTPLESLKSKAQNLKQKIDRTFASELKIEMLSLQSLAGGGSLPGASFESFGLALTPLHFTIKDFEQNLRIHGLIASIQKDRILLDMRTLIKGDEEKILSILDSVLRAKPNKSIQNPKGSQ